MMSEGYGSNIVWTGRQCWLTGSGAEDGRVGVVVALLLVIFWPILGGFILIKNLNYNYSNSN